VSQIQQMFLRIDHAAGRDLKAQEAMGDTRTMKAKARRRETWLYRPLEWAAFSGATKVKLQGPLRLPFTWAGVDSFAELVRAYWESQWLAPAPPGQPGVTWMERAIDFELWTGANIPQDLKGSARSIIDEPTIRQLADVFAAVFKADVESLRPGRVEEGS